MKKRIAALLVMILMMVFVSTALATTVVTSFYPLYLITSNLVTGLDDVTLWNLAAPETGCLHDYQLTTADMKTLAKAELFIMNGAGMESYLEMVQNALPNLKTVYASDGIELIENGPDAETPFNAHVWLDVKNAICMTENIAASLTELLPEQQDGIKQNCESYIARLENLDETLAAGLSNLSKRDIITFHEAFPYFANAYGLNVVGVVNHEPGEALSPGEVAQLCKTVVAAGNPPLFTEPQYPDLAARTIAGETGAKVYELNPAVTGPMDGDSLLTWYEQVMIENMNVLKLALNE